MIRRVATGIGALVLAGSCIAAPQHTSVLASSAPVALAIAAPQAATPARPAATPLGFRLDGPLIQGGVVRGTAPPGTARLMLDGVDVPLTPDRRFVIWFDRDAPAGAMLVATMLNGTQLREPLAVAPRAWRIERLDTLPRIAQPSADFARLRPPELAMIAAARRMETGAGGWRQPFMWPATGRISGLFGAQRIYRGEPGAYHSGVDVAQPTGTRVIAPADGVVILAALRPFTLEGNLLMIDHGMGLNSAFLHLSRIDVRVGQPVRRGETIGAVGMTGRATGPNLHWAMRWRDRKLDPMLIAGPMPATD